MTQILYPNFGDRTPPHPEGNAGIAPGVSAGVTSLLKNSLPLHPGKVRELQGAPQAFLVSLPLVSRVELHMAADSIDHSAILMYLLPGDDTIYSLPLDDFLDLLTERSFEGVRHSIEELLPLLEELFQRIHIELEALNFSPQDHLNDVVEAPWSLDILSEHVYIPGGHFYSVTTADPEEEGLTLDPAHVLDGHPDATVLDLLAAYLEESYVDTSKKYDATTIVEIMYYSYTTRKTHVTSISYSELEDICLTEILDRQPLLQNLEDPSEIIEAYLDRSLGAEVEDTQVIPFSKR